MSKATELINLYIAEAIESFISSEKVLTPASLNMLKRKKAKIGPYELKPGSLKKIWHTSDDGKAVDMKRKLDHGDWKNPSALMIIVYEGSFDDSNKQYALVNRDRNFYSSMM